MKANARVYFSFRSPYSWMAVERLTRAIPRIHDRAEFIPYWEPDQRTLDALQKRGADIRYAPMSKAKHLYILQDTKRLATRLGMRIAWPVDIAPRWEISHLAWLKARQLGYGEAFYNAVTEARWRRGENISDPAVIAALGPSIGLDADVILQATDDPATRAAGVDCLARAYEDDIFGVPYFRLRGHRLWGFDRVDIFVDLFNQMSTDPQPLAAQDIANVGERLDTRPPRGSGRDDVSDARDQATNAVVPQPFDTDTAGGCG